MAHVSSHPMQATGPRLSLNALVWAQQAVGIAVFVALLALAAQVRVPLPGTPVPVTLQTTVVLLTAFCLRPGPAVLAVGIYLVLGLVAAAAGAAHLFFASFAFGQTMTAGYLVGFLLAAGLVSAVRCRMGTLRFGRTLSLGLLGSLVIFGCGVTWQSLVTGSVESAVALGLAPFVVADLIKVGLVTALVQAVRVIGYEPRV